MRVVAEEQLHVEGGPQSRLVEARFSVRKRTLKAAYAAFNEQVNSIVCVVRNQSETGAKLEFEDFRLIPERFWLHIELDGIKVICTRVWQVGRFCGVKFSGEKIVTRLHRVQVLQTSEEALSRHALKEIEARERSPSGETQQEMPMRSRKVAPRPVFGRKA